MNSFISQLSNVELNNVVSVFLTGSFARGEATESSDLDIWCIFKKIKPTTLNTVGTISRNLPIRYDELELNSQCLTLDEFNSHHFSKFLAYPIIFLEAVLLCGEDIAVKNVHDKEVEKIYKEMLAEVLLSIRHYISVNEPAEKLTHQKIKTWVLKPLMFALRLERFLSTKQYPLTKLDLANAYPNMPKSVQYFLSKEQWDNDILNNYNETLYTLNDEIEKLLMCTV